MKQQSDKGSTASPFCVTYAVLNEPSRPPLVQSAAWFLCLSNNFDQHVQIDGHPELVRWTTRERGDRLLGMLAAPRQGTVVALLLSTQGIASASPEESWAGWPWTRPGCIIMFHQSRNGRVWG